MASDASLIKLAKEIQEEAVNAQLRVTAIRDQTADLIARLKDGDTSLTVEEAQSLYNSLNSERQSLRDYYNANVATKTRQFNAEWDGSLWTGAAAKEARATVARVIDSAISANRAAADLLATVPALITKLESNQKAKDSQADNTKQDPAEDTAPADNNLGGQSSDDDQSLAETNRLNRSGSLAVAPGGDQSDAETARLARSGVPTTTAGAAGSSTAQAPDKKSPLPKRPFNPLSKFASYTYNITLYMMSPDAFNVFVRGGKKTVRGPNGEILEGIYVVAQSGGINTSVDQRPPGMTMDYYIDNLKFKSFLTGAGSTDASNVTNITFNIYEPLGFSFITKLAEANRQILQTSKLSGVNTMNNTQSAMRQCYVLGIGFAGYTGDGEIGKVTEIFASDTFGSGNGAVYERFLDIVITKMTFNLDGGMVNYSITASPRNTSEAMGTKYGVILSQSIAKGETVEEALIGPSGIIPFINEQQQKLFQEKKVKFPVKYDIKWVDDPASDKIKNAKLITKEEFTTLYTNKLQQLPMTGINKITQVNDATSVNNGANGKAIKELKFAANTSLGGVIKKIIQSSTYLGDALTAINLATEEVQSPENGQPDDTQERQVDTEIQWYCLGSQVEIEGFDEQRNDWAYKITYIISPYKTPFTYSSYASKPARYYGPHKRYNYWFTGENTEILRYTQSMNNAFYMAEAGYANATTAAQGPVKVPGQRVEGDKQGTLGQGLDPQNSYITSLYSPGDWVNAKLEILGDPDFLMYDSPGNLNEAYSYFYADQQSFTINPSGGQVFIEINFAEGTDYNHDNAGTYVNDGNYSDTGLMTVNRSILFWNYPKSVQKRIQGISYLLREVQSTFSKGKFTQELTCSINTFPNVKESSNATSQNPAQREADENARELSSLTARYGQSTSTGQIINASADRNNNSSSTTGNGDPPPVGVAPRTTNGVADDDGSNARDQLLARQRVPVPQDNTRPETVDEAFARSGLGGP